MLRALSTAARRHHGWVRCVSGQPLSSSRAPLVCSSVVADSFSAAWPGRIQPSLRLFSSPSTDAPCSFEQLVAKGALPEAQQALSLPETANGRSQRLRLIDAWIDRQQQLLADSDTNLKALRECVESAHALLEELAPMLGRKMMVVTPTLSALEAAPPAHRNFDAELSQRCDAVLEAWATLSRAGHGQSLRLLRGVPQRAQFLLERMQASFASTDETAAVARPSVESYNSVLEAWAWSDEHLRGAMAERIFDQVPRPNAHSYRAIILAWCQSRDRRAAFTATGHLMKMLRKLEKGDEDMEPELEDYQMVLRAWTKAEDKLSPGKANSVLRLMDSAYTKGVTEVQPDLPCFRYALCTAAQRPHLDDLGTMVNDILTRMKELYIVPDSDCYTSAIRTWKNAALNPNLEQYRDKSANRALELLAEMKIAHNQSQSTSVQTRTENINDVIEALSVSSNSRRIEQAERLLSMMEAELSKEAPYDPLPNAESYRLTLNVWRTSSAVDKVPRALAILWRMKNNYGALSGTSKKNDFVEAFNTFVAVCGSTRTRGEAEGMQVFREALAGIEGMKTLPGLRPNASSYSGLLTATRNLLPLGKERKRVVDQIFRLCCDDGMVDDNVLRELRITATDEQYARLVIGPSETIEGTKMVPETWTSNALGGRVITADGRKTTPLSIDGRLTVTIAMREFQMRRIRDKRNRNLLQGGRLQHR